MYYSLLMIKVNRPVRSSKNQFGRNQQSEGDKRIWDKLEICQEGTNKVKKTKIDLLQLKYEMFEMDQGEDVDLMFKRLTKIINELGETYPTKQVWRRILQVLPTK